MLSYLFNYETSRRFRQLVSRNGINLRLAVNARPLDITDRHDINPIAALYQAGTRSVLLSAPLSLCITSSFLAFPAVQGATDPKVETLKDYANGHCDNYQGSPLENFYKYFLPSNAAELMGLDDPSFCEFNELPPSAALRPWQQHDPEQASELQRKVIASEARQHKRSMGAAKGNQHFGPVLLAQGQLEFKRLISVYKSIQQNGLMIDKEGFNNIEALCLINEKKLPTWRYFIYGGQHRIAALVALGYKTINLQVRQEGLGGIIRRDDAEYWPTVQKGYFTKKEAQAFFDRLFAQRQPSLLLRQWSQICQ